MAIFPDLGMFDVMSKLPDERFRIELHVIQHLANGVAFDHRVEDDVAAVVEADVDGVGVAEQVVQVAEDLLMTPTNTPR